MITLTFSGASSEEVLKEIKEFLGGHQPAETPSEPKQAALPKPVHPTNAERFIDELKSIPEEPKKAPKAKEESHATSDQVCSLFKQLSAKKFCDKDGNPGETGLQKVQGIFKALGKTRVRELTPEELDKAAAMAIDAMQMPF